MFAVENVDIWCRDFGSNVDMWGTLIKWMTSLHFYYGLISGNIIQAIVEIDVFVLGFNCLLFFILHVLVALGFRILCIIFLRIEVNLWQTIYAYARKYMHAFNLVQ